MYSKNCSVNKDSNQMFVYPWNIIGYNNLKLVYKLDIICLLIN